MLRDENQVVGRGREYREGASKLGSYSFLRYNLVDFTQSQGIALRPVAPVPKSHHGPQPSTPKDQADDHQSSDQHFTITTQYV
jgi:hypothetical protein